MFLKGNADSLAELQSITKDFTNLIKRIITIQNNIALKILRLKLV